MPGTLAFATDTDQLRVQTSLGWQDVPAFGTTPTHRWTAANSTTTTIPDLIRTGNEVDFTGTCTKATDADGIEYLGFNGTTNFFQGGNTSSFRYLHDGRPFTFAVVVDWVTLPGTQARLFNTCNGTANVGCVCRWDFSAANQQGLVYYACGGSSGNNVHIAWDRYPIVGKQVYVVRSNGYTQTATNSNATSNASSVALRRTGFTVAVGGGNPAIVPTSGSIQTNVATIGRRADAAAEFGAFRLYELTIVQGCWTDAQVEAYEQYARQAYVLN